MYICFIRSKERLYHFNNPEGKKMLFITIIAKVTIIIRLDRSYATTKEPSNHFPAIRNIACTKKKKRVRPRCDENPSDRITYEYQTKAANCMITRIRDMIKFLSYRRKSSSVLVKPGAFSFSFQTIQYQYREHQGDDK